MGEKEYTDLYLEVVLGENVTKLSDFIFEINKRLAQCDYFFGAIHKVSESSSVRSKIFEATKRLRYGKYYNGGINPIMLQLDNIAIIYRNKVIELRNLYVSKYQHLRNVFLMAVSTALRCRVSKVLAP